MNKLFYLALIVLFAFSACNKDENSPEEQSMMDLITAQSWIVKSAVLEPGIHYMGYSITNIYTMVEACSRDDFFTFESTGIASLDQGTEVCDASAPQTISNNWEFNEDKTQLIFNPALQYNLSGVGVLELESVSLIELTENKLVIEFEYVEPFLSTNQTVTIEFLPKV